MKSVSLYFALFILTFLASCANKNNQNNINGLKGNSKRSPIPITSEYDKYFDECKVEGSFLIYREVDGTWISNDSTDINRVTVPASTFKIINLLIALETGVIKNEKEVVKWPGIIDTLKYGVRPETYKDMSVEDAFKMSAGWVFVELAKRIGRDQYKHFLQLCNYGNHDLSEEDDDFWNFGNFGISPVNQINFLRALQTEELPFSERNINILKRVLVTEINEKYVVRGKTGWSGIDKGLNIGWWVGYIDSDEGKTFFATRLTQDRNHKTVNFGQCRKTITNAILKELDTILD